MADELPFVHRRSKANPEPMLWVCAPEAPQRLVDQVLREVVPAVTTDRRTVLASVTRTAHMIGTGRERVLASVARTVRAKRGRSLNVVVIAHQVGVELVGLALEETVEAVEAPAERPLIEGPGGRALLHAGQVTQVLRFSSGWETTAADWEALEKGIVKVYSEVHGGK